MPDTTPSSPDIEKAAANLANVLREAAYVAVGVGVLGFQRAQVHRVEMAKQIEQQLGALSNLGSNLNSHLEPFVKTAREQLGELRSQLGRSSADGHDGQSEDASTARKSLGELAKSVDDAVAPVRRQVEEQLNRVEDRLPQAARDFVSTVRAAASSQEKAIRSAVGLG